MQKLYFYQGLDGAEILEFLEVVRREARKPASDSDIVSALWEKDFSHIQYYAPDDFLENRILEECGQLESKAPSPDLTEIPQKAIEIKVDTSKFSKGKIELNEEDREVVRERAAISELAQEEGPRIALEKPGVRTAVPGTSRPAVPAEPVPSPEAHKAEAKEEEPVPEEPAPAETQTGPPAEAETDDSMGGPEIHDVESLIASSRAVSPDQEFLNLMVEILNLEDDKETEAENLDVLMEYQLDQLQQSNFGFVVLLVHKLRELRDHLAAGKSDKSALIDSFLRRVSGGRTLDVIKEIFDRDQAVDWDALVNLIKLLGPPALPLAADIFESVPDAGSRAKILEFIRETNKQDPGALASLAADERPALSRAIIGFLSRDFGKKGYPHFAVFLHFKDKDLKREVIHLLGDARDEMASRILAGFLDDPDEDIRVETLLRLDPEETKARVRHFIQEAASRPFRARGLKEKQMFLSFLGRTKTEDALEFLRRTLSRRRPLLTVRVKEMKLAAISGLETMGTEAALEALKRGTRSWKTEVREASLKAVARLAQKTAQTKEG